jgi:predicted phosphodiesterase
MDLIFSDIHSNQHALKALLRYARRRAIRRFTILGDLVGYGAHPNQVIDLILELKPRFVVRGNHDRACTAPEPDLTFSMPARIASAWTADKLSRDHFRFIQELPMGPRWVEEDYQISHGSPMDEDAYLLHPREALHAFDGFESDLCFFGHTHLPGGYELDLQAHTLTMLTFEPGAWFPLRKGCRYLINPGSVGQPRDRDPRVSFMTYDPRGRRLKLHRMDYDHQGAAKAILAAGLPPHLADRLHHGL